MNFDHALPSLVRLVRDVLGPTTLEAGAFLRDAEGRLTFILRTEIAQIAREDFFRQASELLGAYTESPIATPDELFDHSLASNDSFLLENVFLSEFVTIVVRLIDRRIIGQDWDKPDFRPASKEPPLVTFFSCKGGVGRSTALVITAAALSQQGKNVLVVDFDLEAPGLGPLLLAASDLPPYGLLDLLVSERIEGFSEIDIEKFIAPSPLTGGKGLVEVMPAIGMIGRDNPENIIPKLGRAFLDGWDHDAQQISFLMQVRGIIEKISNRKRSDVILVDARAGLSESSAPAAIGLGGSVLLFGVDTPQTFECYRYLLKHMARFANPDSLDDWRYKLRMVHAKAGRGENAWRHFREQAHDVFSEALYDEVSGSSLELFSFDIDDPLGPHYAWPIPFDLEFSEFDPLTRSTALGRDFFERSFGPFVDRLMSLIFEDEVDG